MKTKKIFLLAAMCVLSSYVFGQWNATGDNSTTGNLSVGSTSNNWGRITLYSKSSSYLSLSSKGGSGMFFIRNSTDAYAAIYSDYNSTEGMGLRFETTNQYGVQNEECLYIDGRGYVAINHVTPEYQLDVRGTVYAHKGIIKNELEVKGIIRAQEVIIETSGADFVFEEGYQLRSLGEVKAHIEEHKHLPEIPSAADMQENGVGVSELATKLLQKVEELTLYTIQQNEKAEQQQQLIEQLNRRIEELEINQK